jgi:hypothetical protein
LPPYEASFSDASDSRLVAEATRIGFEDFDADAYRRNIGRLVGSGVGRRRRRAPAPVIGDIRFSTAATFSDA